MHIFHTSRSLSERALLAAAAAVLAASCAGGSPHQPPQPATTAIGPPQATEPPPGGSASSQAGSALPLGGPGSASPQSGAGDRSMPVHAGGSTSPDASGGSALPLVGSVLPLGGPGSASPQSGAGDRSMPVHAGAGDAGGSALPDAAGGSALPLVGPGSALPLDASGSSASPQSGAGGPGVAACSDNSLPHPPCSSQSGAGGPGVAAAPVRGVAEGGSTAVVEDPTDTAGGINDAAPVITFDSLSEGRPEDIAEIVSVAQRHWAPRRVARIRFFVVTDERTALDLCVAETGGTNSYHHVQHVMEPRATGWEIDGTFNIGIFEGVDSCVVSFE